MMWYGKKNVDAVWSMNIGRLPSSMRTLVHTRPASAWRRQVEQVAQQRLLVLDMDAHVSDHGPMLAAGRPCVTGPMVPPGVGTMRQPA